MSTAARIVVRHSCGLVATYDRMAEMVEDVRAMYPGADFDGARSLVWAEGDGMPVAEIYYRPATAEAE